EVAGDVGGEAVRAAVADSVDVFDEVSRIRVVQTVALVRIASVRHVDQRIDGEARDHGPVRVSPDVVLGNDLLRGDEDGRGGHGDVRVHVRISVDLAVAEPVGAVDVDERDVGEQGGHGVQRLAGVGTR